MSDHDCVIDQSVITRPPQFKRQMVTSPGNGASAQSYGNKVMASDLAWKVVDVATLSADAQQQFAAMKEAYRAYTAAKALFEDGMQERFGAALPEHLELKFGYNFGKLSVAVGPKREGKAKAKAPAQGLAEFLAAQANGGHRA